MKLEFKTFYGVLEQPERYFSNSGDRIVPVYTPNISPDGHIDLIQSGEHNLYAEIQSHKDSVDINVILERFVAGDLDALNRRPALYLDVSEMPKTYAEMYQKVIDAEQYFKSLPLEVREAFDQSPEKFFVTMGSPEFNEIMSRFVPSAQKEAGDPAPAAADPAPAAE